MNDTIPMRGEEGYQAHLDATYPKTPKPITRDRYEEMLNVLPPANWHHGRQEFFQLCEMAHDEFTLTCVWDWDLKQGWEFYAPAFITRAQVQEILAAVRS